MSTPKKSGATASPRTAPAAATSPATGFKVRATQLGYYEEALWREGDVFLLRKPRDFSARWMERVDERTPERLTTAAQSLLREHDEILGGAVSAATDPIGD